MERGAARDYPLGSYPEERGSPFQAQRCAALALLVVKFTGLSPAYARGTRKEEEAPRAVVSRR
jgi:hypothetical protein